MNRRVEINKDLVLVIGDDEKSTIVQHKGNEIYSHITLSLGDTERISRYIRQFQRENKEI